METYANPTNRTIISHTQNDLKPSEPLKMIFPTIFAVQNPRSVWYANVRDRV